MCLLVVAHRLHPRFDLLVAANRDERHSRPAAAVDHWTEVPGLIAGRDLAAGGTWLGADGLGRFGSVTNFRDEETTREGAPSRGELVLSYLSSGNSARVHLESLEDAAPEYAGFSLMLADGDELWYASYRLPGFARPLGPGVHALSNHLLDTAWPKVELSRLAMRGLVDDGGSSVEPLFTMLADARITPTAPGVTLPQPAASGPFIAGPTYGTRCSTVVAREGRQRLLMEERRFGPGGSRAGSTRLSIAVAA